MIRLLIFVRFTLLLSFLVITFHITNAQTSKIDSLQVVLKSLPTDTNKVNTLVELCKAQLFSDSREIISTANEALTLSKKINYKPGQARAYFQLAHYFHKVGNDLKAIELLFEARNISKELGDSAQVAYAYNDIGLIYSEQGDNEEALPFFNHANLLWNKVDFKSGMCHALLNLGLAYEGLKKDSLALLHYEQALSLSEKDHNEDRIGRVLLAMGSIYLRQKNYAKSLYYEKKALENFKKADMTILQSRVYNILSQVYLSQNQPVEALHTAEQARQLAAKVASKNDLKDSYYRAAKACEKLKDYPKAYKLQSLYITLSDSLKNSQAMISMDKLDSKYKLEKKESEIEMLIQQNQMAEFRRNLFIIILTGILIISFLLYNRYRIITQRRLLLKKQQLDLFTQELIEKSETISKISDELKQLKRYNSDENIQIAKIDKILQSSILTDEAWNNFKTSFSEIYPAFFSKLRYLCPTITTSELRLCSLIKLKLSIKEMASMLGISPESVKTSRYRLKKKLNLTENETIEDFIEKLGVFHSREEIEHLAAS